MRFLLSLVLVLPLCIGCGGETKMRKEGEKPEVTEETAKPSAPDFGSEKP